MAIKKIPCGGFMYDDETVEFEDGVMRAKGGGSGGGGTVVNFNIQIIDEEGEEKAVISADKTPAEVIAAAVTGPVMGTVIAPDMDVREISPLGSVVFKDPASPAFWFRGIGDYDIPKYAISTLGDNWVVDLM